MLPQLPNLGDRAFHALLDPGLTGYLCDHRPSSIAFDHFSKEGSQLKVALAAAPGNLHNSLAHRLALGGSSYGSSCAEVGNEDKAVLSQALTLLHPTPATGQGSLDTRGADFRACSLGVIPPQPLWGTHQSAVGLIFSR